MKIKKNIPNILLFVFMLWLSKGITQHIISEQNNFNIYVKDSIIDNKGSITIHFCIENLSNDTVFIEKMTFFRAEIVFNEKYRRIEPDYIYQTQEYYEQDCNHYSLTDFEVIPPKQGSIYYSIDLGKSGYTLISSQFDVAFEKGRKYYYYIELKALSPFVCDKFFHGIITSEYFYFILN